LLPRHSCVGLSPLPKQGRNPLLTFDAEGSPVLEARLPCGGANSIFLRVLIHQKVNEPNIAEPAGTMSCQINQMRMHSHAKTQKFKNFYLLL